MVNITTHLTHLPAHAQGFALAELMAGKLGPAPDALLHIALGDREMEVIAAQFAYFAPHIPIFQLPAWDTMPYDRSAPKAALMAERVQTLCTLQNLGSKSPHPNPLPMGEGSALRAQGEGYTTSPFLLLTSANAALQKLPPRNLLKSVGVQVTQGQKIAQSALIEALIKQGYHRVGKAMEAGEFAVRGSLLDVIPAGAERGIRMDWFGDELEKLRHFDVLSQLTQGELREFSLFPTSEILLSPQSISLFRERYREIAGSVQKEDALYEAVSNGQYYAGMEHWLPLFYEKTETIFDYAAGALISFDEQTGSAIAERQESILDYYQARIESKQTRSKTNLGDSPYHPVPPAQAFIMEGEWQALLEQNAHVVSSPFMRETPAVNANIRIVAPFIQNKAEFTPFDQLRERVENASAQHKRTLIACMSIGSRDRLQTLLMERGFHVVTFDDIHTVKGKALGLITLPLEQGFETDTLVIISEQDVLGERMARSVRKKKNAERFLAEAASFSEGELVVHKEHGIGRFEGLITLDVQGAKHDCLKLIYDGDAKLFLPVENIELLTRYGNDGEEAKLDKLGGASWQARKAKLKERIGIAAEALLKIAAERAMKTADVMEAELGKYDEFAARFGYVETEDQARSIAEVLSDLQAGKPMDRLICGDVGFGKTEVAMRAAFVAVCSEIPSVAEGSLSMEKDPSTREMLAQDKHKNQVALIAPTTLLARQHYANFKKRFEGFGVRVAQLSRMVSAREQTKVREGLANGEVDIVVGTHALLAKNISFNKLALVIVDEEQHFGVAQKEKLKSLKSDVHVLTLSATPIPRTLHMALTGVRDLSLITTPPIDRLAVRSFVMPFDPVIVREAIQRELHRGGRCFIVTPRIKDMGDLKQRILELVPEAKLAIANGQIPMGELDDIMNDFYDGKTNVLLSTAIIESGLDIPIANTMIIHNAHLFGLSQLYQLRGRVGRGKTRAYAYFMLPHKRELSANAAKRLEVMQTLDTLGAGFTLANHDMDIRGFGNLVGEEQSGHIREVGIELYQQMLEEAVAALRSGQKPVDSGQEDASLVCCPPSTAPFSPQINLSLSVLIPEHYVNDLSLRMGLYKRAANLADAAEIDSFAAELIDRFGPMPEETAHLIEVLGIKLRCKQARIERIDCGPKGAVLSFFENTFPKPDALIAFVGRRISTLKIRPDQKLVYAQEWKTDEQKLAAVKKLVEEIGRLVG